MAFIVMMFNGKRNTLEIMGLDSDGELYVERVITTGEPDPEYRRFSCSGSTWEKVLELGRKMEWKPTGSVLEKTIDSPNPTIGDYKPSSWGDDDYKIFIAKDSSALADALDRALYLMKEFQLKEYGKESPTYIVQGMNEQEHKQINQNLSKEFLSDFISFLRKGKFKFVWDD